MINLNSPTQTHKYMSSALFIENKTSRAVRKKTLSQKIEFGKTSLTFLTIILVAMVSLVYLAHANKSATKGYVLKELQQEQVVLLKKLEVVDMQIAEATSLQKLDGDAVVASMITADGYDMIVGDTAVAMGQ